MYATQNDRLGMQNLLPLARGTMEKGKRIMETPQPKVLGAMKHLLLELQKVGAINDIDREHFIREYVIGRIIGFGHLAEYLLATGAIGLHNHDQIIRYGRRYGENR
jgi:hypothetical protein